MIIDIDPDKLKQTISFLETTASADRMLLPEDQLGRMIPSIDSPLVKKVLIAEDLATYWNGINNDRRKNGIRL